MSAKSLIGRIIMLPLFIPVVALEAILYKCDGWALAVHRLRIRMERLADKAFPLDNNKKTNI